MATWNSRQPLKIAPTPPTQEELSKAEAKAMKGIAVKSPYRVENILINQGEKIPDKLLTEDFIGGALNQLAGLSADDWLKYERWKARQKPAIQDRWKDIEEDPVRIQSIFPQGRSMATVEGSEG